MRFRKMSEHMPEKEIRIVFQIVLPFGKMLNYERHLETNYISVRYTIPEDNPQEHELDLLPDDVYYECEKVGKEKILQKGDILHQYRQFTVARGYSEIWLNNPFIKRPL